jgi:hypothetical protein
VVISLINNEFRSSKDNLIKEIKLYSVHIIQGTGLIKQLMQSTHLEKSNKAGLWGSIEQPFQAVTELLWLHLGVNQFLN